MNIELRVILVVIGLLIIIGLIISDRIKRKRIVEPPSRQLSEREESELPSMSATHDSFDHNGDHDELSGLRSERPVSTGDIESEAEQTTVDVQTPEQLAQHVPVEPTGSDDADDIGAENGEVLSLLILAPKGETFRGSQVKMVLNETGFTYGSMDIFHQMDGDDVLVSIANVLEPGSFDLGEMITLKTPGLVVFSQLPAARSGGEIFAAWYKAAKKLNAALGGRLVTINRMPLEDGYIEKLRQQAEGFPAISPHSEQHSEQHSERDQTK